MPITIREISQDTGLPITLLSTIAEKEFSNELSYVNNILAINESFEKRLVTRVTEIDSGIVNKEKQLKAAWEATDNTIADQQARGYRIERQSLSLKAVNLVGLLLAIITAVIYARFDILWPDYAISEADNSLTTIGIRIALILSTCVICAPIHEAIHGIGFLPGCHWVWKGKIQLDFSLHYMTAFCRCAEAQKKKSMIVAVMLPFIVLSIFPMLTGIVLGIKTLCFVSCLHALGCVGDFYYVIVLSRIKADMILNAPVDYAFYSIEFPAVGKV